MNINYGVRKRIVMLKRNFLFHRLMSFAWLLILVGISFQSLAQDRPNVVVILADDLGYGDLGCYGATKLKTPHIDKIAKEGRIFTDAHSVSAVCTPSRYGMLTGEYPFRANIWGPLGRSNKLLIDTGKLTLAKVMKQQGYATACIGKWHLGFGEKTPNNWNERLVPGPLQLGFDYYFGVPHVNSGPPYVYVENEYVVGIDPNDPLVLNGTPITPTMLYPDKSPNKFSGGEKAHALYVDETIGTTLAGKAVKWIKDQKDQPFFLYLATTNIHHPFTPHQRFKGTSESGRYGDFVHELDWIVGEVMNALNEAQVSGNTLVIFTSDNGGMLNKGGREAWEMGHRMNGDLLGFKFDVWEGGHRVPFITRWPGRIEANSKSNQLLSNIDLLATMASLTGFDLLPGAAPDSYNMLEAFTDNPKEQIRKHLVLAPFKRQSLALRMGKWMYIGNKGGGGWEGLIGNGHIVGGAKALQFTGEKNSDVEDGAYRPEAPMEQLYNLEVDLSQRENVTLQNPEITKMMKETLRLITQTNYTRQKLQMKIK